VLPIVAVFAHVPPGTLVDQLSSPVVVDALRLTVETNLISLEFWPNDGTPTTAEIFTTLNRRDQATLYPADPPATT
jgi:hypothetical protein